MIGAALGLLGGGAGGGMGLQTSKSQSAKSGDAYSTGGTLDYGSFNVGGSGSGAVGTAPAGGSQTVLYIALAALAALFLLRR